MTSYDDTASFLHQLHFGYFQRIKLKEVYTEPRKGRFLSDIYQKRNWNKEIRTEIKTKKSRLIDLLYRLNDIK